MGTDSKMPPSGSILLSRRTLAVALGSCAASSLAASCATRREPEMADEQATASMRVWTHLKAKTPMITTGEGLARVATTGRRILDASGLTIGQPDYVLFDGPDVQAIVLPGGQIGVFTGLLNLCACDGELAAVLGRELGHLIAHPTKLAEKPKHFLAWPPIAYSHAQEKEADVLGLTYAAKAGYDPRDVLSIWRKVTLNRQVEPTPRALAAPPDNQRLERIVTELRKMGYQV